MVMITNLIGAITLLLLMGGLAVVLFLLLWSIRK